MTEGNGRPDLPRVREELAELEGYEVVLFGSYVTSDMTPRSDIDVAVVTRRSDEETNRAIWRETLGRAPDRYDVRVFELLPLDIQHEIVQDHDVVFGDPVSLSYYFYRVRRTWKDVGPRIENNRFENARERMRLLGEG